MRRKLISMMKRARSSGDPTIDRVREFAPGLDAYWKGHSLYITSYRKPFCRLRHVQMDPDLYMFDIFKWSTEAYSSTYFGHDQKPLPLETQLEFAVGLRKTYGLGL